MARRRLLTILATIVVAGGLSAAPAVAGPLDDLTGGLEDTVTTVTDEVVDDLGSGAATTTPPAVEVGTGDGTLDVRLQVDVAPSDADGSPQLEIDGGITVAEQPVDVGAVTDPIEDAVDPDPDPDPTPAPSPSPSPTPSATPSSGQSSDAVSGPTRPSGHGGVLEGGGLVAASTGTPSPVPTGEGPFARTVASGSLDGSRFGVKRYGGGTMHLDRVPDPEVAPPVDAAVPAPRTASPSAAPDTQAPAVRATGAASGATDSGPMPGLLRAFAAAMVLGTGAAWVRASRRA